ncbi:unnamed protein product [Pleuronectes platessa]|uniref:Uncharacterized protein n=1 Tax=Pleuronectes platessa TaxID=8262 RepID=A0A9N7YD10_PLEPL|nr:unnamed protein product [Pleuronectes platessa]
MATGLCPRGDPRSSADSNSIKVPFICQGGPSNRLGRASEAEKATRFAQQHRGPTFAGSCMDSPSVPAPSLLPQFTHVPASNKCSETPRPGEEWEGEFREEQRRGKVGELPLLTLPRHTSGTKKRGETG